jgi:hypothetical protein
MPPSGKLSVGIWKIRFRKKSDQSMQAFVRKSMETKSKMAAVKTVDSFSFTIPVWEEEV